MEATRGDRAEHHGAVRLFRISIACDLIYSAGAVGLLLALHVILRPVNRYLAPLPAFCRLVYAYMWILMALNLFDALRLLSAAGYLGAFDTWASLHLPRVSTSITSACGSETGVNSVQLLVA